MPSPRDQFDPSAYLISFIDTMRLEAEHNGRKSPQWSDAWVAAVKTPKLAEVLAEKGVQVGQFLGEIQYISRFTDIFTSKDAPFAPEVMARAAESLMKTLEGYAGLQKIHPMALQAAHRALITNVGEELARQYHDEIIPHMTKQGRRSYERAHAEFMRKVDETRALSDDERAAFVSVRAEIMQNYDALERLSELMASQVEKEAGKRPKTAEAKAEAEARDYIFKNALGKTMERLGRRMIISIMGNSDDLPEGLIESVMGGELPGQVVNLLEAAATEMSKALLSQSGDEETDELQLVEMFKHIAVRGQPSPLDLMELILSQSDDVFIQLLHRNGMRHTDADATDPLEKRLPPAMIQRALNTALDRAYTYNSVALTPRHIALALLGTPEVSQHLRKLGIKDLLDLSDKFRETTAEGDTKPEGRIFVHPRIGADIHTCIAGLETAYGKHPHPAALLRNLIAKYPEIDKAMNRAGLRRTMLKVWDAQYDKDLKDDDNKANPDAKKGEKKKPVFKVDDYELESLIKEYAVDYTAKAKDRAFDPMIGNADVLAQVETKLLKRGKKNPIVIGDPGIGKSKVLEGLAMAIVSGKVHPDLVGARVLSLDLHQMNDTPYIGVFEGRLLSLLKGIAERNATRKGPPIILEVDELDLALKAGGHSFSPGFQGLVKPFLTSGEIMLVGAATRQGFTGKIASDPAFARRTQPVYMQEPGIADTVLTLKGLKRRFSSHHSLQIKDTLLEYVATQAARFIFTVKNPDKSVDLLDEACAEARKAGAVSLSKMHIDRALSSKTGIPFEFLSRDERARYATIEKPLKRRVLQQDPAVDAVAMALKRAKAGFVKPGHPIGNFLFVGPTGVGKTELSKALTFGIFGDEKFLKRYDMGEFQEKHSVGRLIGAPPGYANHDDGGKLINDLLMQGFGVYLFDEVEKAHPDVFDALIAPFDDGKMTDGRGVEASMTNVLNIMTTNLGTREVREEGARRKLNPKGDPDKWAEMARPIYLNAVKAHFRPEFLNRLDGIIVFDRLLPRTVNTLVNRQVMTTAQQLRDGYGLELELAPVFRQAASERGFDPENGARPLQRAWADMLTGPMAEFLLLANPRQLSRAKKLEVIPTDGEPGDGESNVVVQFEPPVIARKGGHDPKTVAPRFVLCG